MILVYFHILQLCLLHIPKFDYVIIIGFSSVYFCILKVLMLLIDLSVLSIF